MLEHGEPQITRRAVASVGLGGGWASAREMECKDGPDDKRFDRFDVSDPLKSKIGETAAI
jgi:hypothetical protein